MPPADGSHVTQRLSLVRAGIALPRVILTVDGIEWPLCLRLLADWAVKQQSGNMATTEHGQDGGRAR